MFDHLVDLEYLPIFCVSDLRGSLVTGRFNKTPIHFPSLAPSEPIEFGYSQGWIGFEEFAKRYTIELAKRVNLPDIFKKLGALARASRASGIALIGSPSKDPGKCYRSVLADIINLSGLVREKVTEY